MVERHTSEGIDEFSASVVAVDIVNTPDGQDMQYHIAMKPLDVEVKGKTGMMHDWIKIPASAKDNSVPEGSVLDFYLQDLELCSKDVKKIQTHAEVMQWMVGKYFLFAKKKYGKAFQGKEAADHWSPRRILSASDIKDAISKKSGEKRVI